MAGEAGVNSGSESSSSSSTGHGSMAAASIPTNLTSLRLIGSVERNILFLDQLTNIRHLTKLRIDERVAKLPSASNFPPNLSYLKLHQSYLREDPMPVLQKLPQLLYLNLGIDSYIGLRMVLWRLEIFDSPLLESLPEELRFMTNLKQLKMETTPQLVSELQGVNSHTSSPIYILSS
ncbi:putative disease resistance RPP8-like protein 4 [Sesamum alatum]|uniref:Disease resistance RPP8-like protein 4 n=1 Tax=Sesamum alatum TaxID=300844 RepID=A0AAE1YMI5_9LAMI|nr:putative disease resistance RPP8-like protein 4 [Sesamum alatum]